MMPPSTSPTTPLRSADTTHSPPGTPCASAATAYITCAGPATPSTSAPWVTICPPTHSIAAVPMIASQVISTGTPFTSPRPTACATGLPRWARWSPTSSAITISATTP